MHEERPDITDARQIRSWLLECGRYSRETARRTLQQLNAACNWAVSMDLIEFNPFSGLTRYLGPGRQQTGNNYTAFTADERQAILSEFKKAPDHHWDWVWFLFHTGCRPEEASALRWEDVASDFSEILINEALPVDTRIRQPTKTYRTTRFPCNQPMREFLSDLHDRRRPGVEWLIPAASGGPFDYKNFQTRYWKPRIEQLVSDRKLSFYLSEYHCRHTFITEMVSSGMSEQDVSYLCRVSPYIIQAHYLSQSRRVEVPVF